MDELEAIKRMLAKREYKKQEKGEAQGSNVEEIARERARVRHQTDGLVTATVKNDDIEHWVAGGADVSVACLRLEL